MTFASAPPTARAASTIGLGLVLAAACRSEATPTGNGTSSTGTGAGTATATAGLDDPAAGTATTTTGSTGDLDHGALEAIELVPGDHVLAVDLGVPTSLELTALGHFADGAVIDVTADASFGLEGSRLGTLDGARLELPAFSEIQAGSARITAALDGRMDAARILVVAHPRSGPDAQALFVLPYRGTSRDPAGPSTQAVAFDTAIDRLDLVLDVQATGAMGGPIAELQATLRDTVIPATEAAVPDAWFGVAAFMDYPIAPFGTPDCDQPFVLLQPVTASADAAELAALALTDGLFGGPIGCGSDAPAAHLEALWQLATGTGLDDPAPTFVAPRRGGLGGAGLRAGALPVIVSLADARSHDPAGSACDEPDYDSNPAVAAVAAGRAPTKAALTALCGRVVTMAIGDFAPTCSPLADGVELAEATDAVVHPTAWDLAPGGRPPGCAADRCCTGLAGAGVAPSSVGLCPLAHRIPFGGGGLGERIAEAVGMLARYAPITVTAAVHGAPTGLRGAPLPAGLDSAAFVASVTPEHADPGPLPGAPAPTLTTTAFAGLVPGTPVAFEVVGRNEIVPATEIPQLFLAAISTVADGCVALDARTLLVVVPPADSN